MNAEAYSPPVCELSFIVPAHNEQLLLGRALDSIQAAALNSGLRYEVIVVDDASTDRTPEIARDYDCRLLPVILRQIAAVRNAGAKQAAGEILIFVDADTVLPKETLSAALRAIQNGAIGGGARLAFDGPTAFWAHAILPACNLVSRWARLAPGCFLFVRRNAFFAVGGFDERYYAAEEWVLSQALKRHGRFVMLVEPSITSGRKGTTRDLLWTLGLLFRLLLRGNQVLQRREGLELWYGAAQRAAVSQHANEE